MNDFNQQIQGEVDKNYDFFKTEVGKIIATHFGQFALLKNASIVDYFDSFEDAEKYANMAYADRLYSIQKVDDTRIELGFIGTRVYA